MVSSTRQSRGQVVTPLHRGWARLRPLHRGETVPLLDVFDGLSVSSRADRYLTGMASLPSRMLHALADVDGCARVGWLAVVADQPVAIGRYAHTAPATAELAFEVADAYQGRGLGTALLDTITTVAAANGVRRVCATVLPTNEPARRLMAMAGIPLALDDRVLEGEADLRLLDPPRVDRDAVLSLAAWPARAPRTRCPHRHPRPVPCTGGPD